MDQPGVTFRAREHARWSLICSNATRNQEFRFFLLLLYGKLLSRFNRYVSVLESSGPCAFVFAGLPGLRNWFFKGLTLKLLNFSKFSNTCKFYFHSLSTHVYLLVAQWRPLRSARQENFEFCFFYGSRLLGLFPGPFSPSDFCILNFIRLNNLNKLSRCCYVEIALLFYYFNHFICAFSVTLFYIYFYFILFLSQRGSSFTWVFSFFFILFFKAVSFFKFMGLPH